MARVISLLGKGGVGKSTLTLAMAQAEARRGKRVLVLSLETVSTIGLLLDTRLGASLPKSNRTCGRCTSVPPP